MSVEERYSRALHIEHSLDRTPSWDRGLDRAVLFAALMRFLPAALGIHASPFDRWAR